MASSQHVAMLLWHGRPGNLFCTRVAASLCSCAPSNVYISYLSVSHECSVICSSTDTFFSPFLNSDV
uniref:Uncharacterized protein n=1 Tax=Zea mays TaxID=4577 RepID=B4FNS9_MAIZE|nr:unknown [Zea mays]